MNLPQYNFLFNDLAQAYQFTSVGSNGLIEKIVQSTKINDDPLVYNLALGDYNSVAGKIDDEVVSNNKDTEMVFATIASIVVDFCNSHQAASIFVEGNTAVKARLYQIMISKHLTEIEMDFLVYGFVNETTVEFFIKNKPYRAILVKPL
jgi:hypothetical protein